MRETIIKTRRKAPLKMFEALYFNGEKESSFLFVSDATRKPLQQEFLEAYKKDTGAPLHKDAVVDIYQIGNLYDFTTRTQYRIRLIPMK